MSKLTVALVIVLVAAIFARDIYISQGRGNDETGTGTQASPYRTFQKALTLVADGDKIKAELGAYQHTSVINKAISIEGIREHAKLPLFSGKFTVSNVASFSISNVDVEFPSSELFTISKVGKVSLGQLKIGPASTAMSIKGVDELEMTDLVFSGIFAGPKIGGTGSDIVKAVSITRCKFNDIKSQGVVIQNTDRLIVDGSEFNDMCNGVSTPCGLRIIDSRNFMVRNSKAIGSELGMYVESSSGSIENVEIANSKRVYSSYGGGLQLKNSQVRTRLLALIGNKAGYGAGFYCDGGSLNMFSGKIEGNVATSAGGAGECVSNCAFFADQVIVRGNNETSPTKCRGL